jgi:phospholipase/carboxylesterase
LERVVGGSVDATLPMVVMVHGLGDRPESMLRVLEDLPGPVRIIAPRAPTPWGRGFAWYTARAREGESPELLAQMRTEAATFAGQLQAVTAARPTQGKPTLAGFSQGGMMSFMVATHHPQAVGKVVPVAGWLPSGLLPGKAPADAPVIRALHGEADPVLSIGPTTASVVALQQLGWDATIVGFPGVEHQIPLPVRTELLEELSGS